MNEGTKNIKPGPRTIDRVERIRDLNTDPYPSRCHVKTSICDVLHTKEMKHRKETVWIAGRILQIQWEEGNQFFWLSDVTGKIKFRAHRDPTQPNSQLLLDILQTGDILEVCIQNVGGEFQSDDIRILAPNHTAGLDSEDKIPSDRTLQFRSHVTKSIRKFFEDRNYLEVETPALSLAPDPAPHLASFTTNYFCGQKRTRLFLPTSPELYMKRLLVAGHERIFQICKFFRNGEKTMSHNPEFTGLEWYEAYADYRSAMNETEKLIETIAFEALGKTNITYQGNNIDLSAPWERLTVKEAFHRYAGFDLWTCLDYPSLFCTAKNLGIFLSKNDTWEDLVFKILIDRIEPHLGRFRPTLLHDYPRPMALLSKKNAKDPSIAERFEVYIGGLEIANGFTELNDPEEQRKRWKTELNFRHNRNSDDQPPLDRDFLLALEVGMPPATGVAVGVDRLIMLLTGFDNIEQVRCFPLKL